MAKGQFGRRIRNLIAAFRGLPPEKSKSFLVRTKPIGESIGQLLKKINGPTVSPEREIQSNWHAIVGERMANRCHPVRILNSDVLLIHSESAVIRNELQMQKAKILENLHRLAHCARICDIRFIANG